MAVKIIYEDKDILVCEKPAGLAVQSARISEPDMVSELKNYLTGKQSIWVSCTGSTSRFPVFWFLPKIKKPQVR